MLGYILGFILSNICSLCIGLRIREPKEQCTVITNRMEMYELDTHSRDKALSKAEWKGVTCSCILQIRTMGNDSTMCSNL